MTAVAASTQGQAVAIRTPRAPSSPPHLWGERSHPHRHPQRVSLLERWELMLPRTQGHWAIWPKGIFSGPDTWPGKGLLPSHAGALPSGVCWSDVCSGFRAEPLPATTRPPCPTASGSVWKVWGGQSLVPPPPRLPGPPPGAGLILRGLLWAYTPTSPWGRPWGLQPVTGPGGPVRPGPVWGSDPSKPGLGPAAEPAGRCPGLPAHRSRVHWL